MTTPAHSAALSATATWDRPVVADGGGDATLLVALTAPVSDTQSERLPVDVAFVLDRSGSMGGPRIQLAKQAILSAVARLTDRDRLSLVVYDHEVETLMPLVRAGAGTQQALKSVLKMVDARGSTALSGGWLRGCSVLADAMPGGGDDRLRRVILLTDGHANQGIVDGGELAEHAGELRRRGIMTTTVGIGDGYDGDLLSGMAAAGGGNHGYIDHPGQMAQFFAAEFDELVAITARNIDLAIIVPAGGRLDLLNAYPAETGGATTHISLGELPSGAEVEIVSLVTLPAAAAGASHAVTARLMWKDLAGTTHTDEVAVLPVTVAAADEVAAAPVAESVAEAAALQGAARLQRQAARSAQRRDYAAFHAARAQMAQVLAAAPDSDRIMGEREAMVAYAPMASADVDLSDPTIALRLSERGVRFSRRARGADWRQPANPDDDGSGQS